MLPDLANIAAMRRRFRITQKDLAFKADVSQSLISKIEAGATVPTYDKAKKIFDAMERFEAESSEVGPKRAKRRLPILEEIRNCTGTVGIADTTFSTIDVAAIAIKEIMKLAPRAHVKRYTVPGIRDTPLACKVLIEKEECDIVLATGMVSEKGFEKRVEDQAVMGIILVQLLTSRHVVCAFFDENSAQFTDQVRSAVSIML